MTYQCGASQKNGVACPNPAKWSPSDNPFCMRCGIHAKHSSPEVKWVEIVTIPVARMDLEA